MKRHATNHSSFLYYYDANGNITRIFDGKKLTDHAYYTYDPLNQLIREDNKAADYTYVYTYSGGNITSRSTYAYTRTDDPGTAINTETWTYGNANWPDLLTSWNDGTSTYTITSNAIGAMTRISNGTNYKSLSWTGRNLTTAIISVDGAAKTAVYKYNADGQRISKTTNAVTTKYYYNGDILAGMIIGSSPWVFMYDENGDYFGFTYSGANYYYVKNLQGDVIGITDDSGTLIVQYSYDAWGKLLAVTGNTTIGNLNPIRYRSYYYDTETGYYYLNSRYYDPELCRFISADEPDYLGANQTVSSYNLFSYCENNPVFRRDSDGNCFTVLGVAIGAMVGFAGALITGSDPVTGAVSGAVSGGLAGAGVDAGLLIVAGLGLTGGGLALAIGAVVLGGAAGGVASTGISSNWNADPIDYLSSGVVGGILNLISFGLAPVGEIAKGTAKEMLRQISVNVGVSITQNIVEGTLVCVGTSLTTVALSTANQVRIGNKWIAMLQ